VVRDGEKVKAERRSRRTYTNSRIFPMGRPTELGKTRREALKQGEETQTAVTQKKGAN